MPCKSIISLKKLFNIACVLKEALFWLTHSITWFNSSLQDLKKFHYYYWFAFPAPSQPAVYISDASKNITNELTTQQLQDLANGYKELAETQKPFFILIKNKDNLIIRKLSEVLNPEEISQPVLNIDINNTYFAFTDPSNGCNPGWPLRTFLAALLQHCPSLVNSNLQVIGIRCGVNGNIENSVILSIKIPEVIKILLTL